MTKSDNTFSLTRKIPANMTTRLPTSLAAASPSSPPHRASLSAEQRSWKGEDEELAPPPPVAGRPPPRPKKWGAAIRRDPAPDKSVARPRYKGRFFTLENVYFFAFFCEGNGNRMVAFFSFSPSDERQERDEADLADLVARVEPGGLLALEAEPEV